jgi:NitT/TauT family transport system permease protein
MKACSGIMWWPVSCVSLPGCSLDLFLPYRWGFFSEVTRGSIAFLRPSFISVIPKIVLMPIIFVLFGLGDTGKIVLITMIIFFQLLITTRDSAKKISMEVIYSLKSLGGNRWHFYRHVVWPVSLPGIFTSLRIGTGTAVAVLFFVESIATRKGLGFYIIDAWGRADYPTMFVGIIALSSIGIILYETFDLLERKLCKWKNA